MQKKIKEAYKITIKQAKSEIEKAEKQLQVLKSTIIGLQFTCDHKNEDGTTAMDEVGHGHNDTLFECEICGSQQSI